MQNIIAAAIALIIGEWYGNVSAQDLEPPSYSNSPVGTNFVILGYGYASGTVLTDPSLPMEDVSNESQIGFSRMLGC